MNKPKSKVVTKTVSIKGIVKEVSNYLQESPAMCKTCKEYSRRNGSAYCQGCADKFKKN